MSANAPDIHQTLDHDRPVQVAEVVPLRVRPGEPDDGQQTATDLVVKNALVLLSAGSIVAFAVWLLA